MRKMIKVSGLDCAHCAANLEEAVKKVDGVNDVKVNFLLEKMVVTADEESIFEKVIEFGKKNFPDYSFN